MLKESWDVTRSRLDHSDSGSPSHHTSVKSRQFFSRATCNLPLKQVALVSERCRPVHLPARDSQSYWKPTAMGNLCRFWSTPWKNHDCPRATRNRVLDAVPPASGSGRRYASDVMEPFSLRERGPKFSPAEPFAFTFAASANDSTGGRSRLPHQRLIFHFARFVATLCKKGDSVIRKGSEDLSPRKRSGR